MLKRTQWWVLGRKQIRGEKGEVFLIRLWQEQLKSPQERADNMSWSVSRWRRQEASMQVDEGPSKATWLAHCSPRWGRERRPNARGHLWCSEGAMEFSKAPVACFHESSGASYVDSSGSIRVCAFLVSPGSGAQRPSGEAPYSGHATASVEA